MKNIFNFAVISKILLSSCFMIFVAALIFYALSALSLPKAKNENTIQIAIVFSQCFILPILFYTIASISLLSGKSWEWGFIIIGGIIIVLLNLPNVALRFIHLGLYLLALVVFFLNKGWVK